MTLDKNPIENIVGKGENAGKHHFLLFPPQCFQPYRRQKSSFLSTLILSSAHAFNLNQLKILSFGIELTLSQTSPAFFMYLQCKSLENTVGKGEIACNENFLPFTSNLKLSSAKSFDLEESKICCSGKS